jgi:hypothetical protein
MNMKWLGVSALMAVATPAAAALTPTWNNYRWARETTLQLKVYDNVSSVWDPYLQIAAADWTPLNNIDMLVVAGGANAKRCAAVTGTIQACSASYGNNGWLGLASIWLTNGYITQATVKLNDYYYTMPKYNNSAFRQSVMCQEVGHTLGLAHADENFTNLNLGTCMDYTNDPSGLLGTNGTLNNLHPYQGDYDALNALYATPGGSQLANTRPTMMAVFGLGIDGSHFEFITGVPEPQSWAMLLMGFGAVGSVIRRKRRLASA